MKDRSRRNPWFRIATLTAVCLALFLTLPAWALAASSDAPAPPDQPGVSGSPNYQYYNGSEPENQPHTDFYIMVPSIIPDRDHDTDAGKQVTLTVIVTDKTTKKPIPGVRVELQDPDRLGVPSITGSREEFHMTDKNGKLQIALFPDPKKRYQISIDHLGYQPYKGRPFTVGASQEMRIELVPVVPLVTPPAIVTAPGVKPPAAATVPPPQKGKHTTSKYKKGRSHKKGSGGEEPAVTEETEVPTQPAIEPQWPPEEDYQPSWDYMGGSGESEGGRVHWLILAGAIVTGLGGGLRLWRIQRKLKELEFKEDLKRRY